MPPPTSRGTDEDEIREQLSRITAPPELDNPQNRKRWKLEELDHKRGPYLVELNVQSSSGLPGAAKDFLALLNEVCVGLAAADGIPPPDAPARVGNWYFRCNLRVKEWRKLIAEDERRAPQKAGPSGEASRAPVPSTGLAGLSGQGHIRPFGGDDQGGRGAAVVRCDGRRLVWAVIDSASRGPSYTSAQPAATAITCCPLRASRIAPLFRPALSTAGGLHDLGPPSPSRHRPGEGRRPRSAHRKTPGIGALRTTSGHGTTSPGSSPAAPPRGTESWCCSGKPQINDG